LIQEAFPEHKDKIAKYYAYAKKAAEAFEHVMAFKMLPLWLVKFLLKTGLFRIPNPGYYYYIRPLGEVLDEFDIKDPELRGVLVYNWPGTLQVVIKRRRVVVIQVLFLTPLKPL